MGADLSVAALSMASEVYHGYQLLSCVPDPPKAFRLFPQKKRLFEDLGFQVSTYGPPTSVSEALSLMRQQQNQPLRCLILGADLSVAALSMASEVYHGYGLLSCVPDPPKAFRLFPQKKR
ncbi:hypothetical protein MRX96_013342 [Rhipicephalus microplus]